MVLPPHDRSAFTLVELAIVLVIMGLIVGGVLVGRDLIRAAELRAVTNEFNQYKVAIGTFKEKYMALPGDMPNAVRFWGAQAGATTDGVDSTCAALTAAATGTATCNGDGSGIISKYDSSVTQPHEVSRAWQHLANAGLVAGSFTGVTNSGTWGQRPGINCPTSKFGSGGWSMVGDRFLSAGYAYPATYGNMLLFGLEYTGSQTVNAVLLPEEQYNIDVKIDDGKPHTGIVLSRPTTSWQPNCSAAGDATYNLTNTSIACSPIFITGY